MDISKIKIGSTTYDIKDSVARSAMTNGTHFIGKLVTDSSVNGAASSITDGDAPSIIETTLGVYTKGTASDGQTQLAAGDIVLYGTSGSNASAPKEFIWDGGKFQELGSTGSLKDLAFKDNASGTFTPAGSNSASAVSFEGGQSGTFVTGFNDDAVAPTFTEGQFTPASIQSGFVSAGSAASYSHSGFDGGSLGAPKLSPLMLPNEAPRASPSWVRGPGCAAAPMASP